MSGVALHDPADSAFYTFEWVDLPPTVTLVSVSHTVPSPLTKVSETTNVAAGTSTVRISGGVHGAMYLIEAQATLSNGESLNRQFPLRVFNG